MVKQYDIYWINLDPTLGKEIKKTRPCVVVSPNESNKHLGTVLIAPLTATIRKYPMRLTVEVKSKRGQVALDQMCCLDVMRLSKKMGSLTTEQTQQLKALLSRYLIE